MFQIYSRTFGSRAWLDNITESMDLRSGISRVLECTRYLFSKDRDGVEDKSQHLADMGGDVKEVTVLDLREEKVLLMSAFTTQRYRLLCVISDSDRMDRSSNEVKGLLDTIVDIQERIMCIMAELSKMHETKQDDVARKAICEEMEEVESEFRDVHKIVVFVTNISNVYLNENQSLTIMLSCIVRD